MGQYYRVVNVDKNEYLHPHELGDGLKLMEFGMSGRGTLSALASLITLNNQGKGPWAGNRIVVAGDYADEGRFVPEEFAALNLYRLSHGYGKKERDEQGLPDAPAFRSATPDVAAQMQLLGITEFVIGEQNSEGIPALMEDHVYDQPEEVFEMLDAPIMENLELTLGNACRSLRCRGVKSGVSWQIVHDVQMTLEKDTGRCLSLKVLWQRRYSGEKFGSSLSFPATSADVRKFFEVNAPKAPALPDVTV